MAGDKTVTYGINFESDAKEVAGGAASDLEALRKSAEESQASIRNMSGALKALRGASAEVTKQKAELLAALTTERGNFSAANLAILQQGKNFGQLQEQIKKTEAAQKRLEAKRQAEDLKHIAEASGKMAKGFQTAGGPLGDLSSRLGGLKDVLGGAGGGMGALTLGVGLAVGVFGAFVAAVADASVKLGTFVLRSADTLRNMKIMHEASTGSAQGAENLTNWVDRLANRLPTAKGRLSEMGDEIAKAAHGFRAVTVSQKEWGQIVSAEFDAAASAASAYGDQAGQAIRSAIEAGKRTGRIQISQEFINTSGLSSKDVVASYAARLHISLAQAAAELTSGRAKLTAGAAAINDAVHKQFDKINAQKMLSFDVQFEKFSEKLTNAAKGVVLGPMLNSLSKLFDLFDANTDTGKAISSAFTDIGNAIADVGADTIRELAGSLKDLAPTIKSINFGGWIRAFKEIASNSVVIATVKGLALGLGVVVGAVGLVIAGAGLTIYAAFWTVKELFIGIADIGEAMGDTIYWLVGAFKSAGSSIAGFFTDIWARWKSFSFAELGKSAIDGIINGFNYAKDALFSAVGGIADSVKNSFKHALGIHSPSTVFAEYGKQTTEGYAQGMERSYPRAQQAADSMAPRSPPTSKGALGATGSVTTLAPVIQFHLPEGIQDPKAMVEAITQPSVLQQFVDALRHGMISEGLPTQAPVI